MWLLALTAATALAQEGLESGPIDLQTALCSTLPAEVSPLAALAGVVRLFEPALPVMLIPSRLALEPDHPDHADLRYLRERRVLSATAVVDPMSREAWQAAFDALTQWYRLERVVVGDPLDPRDRARDIAALVERIALAVRPLALIGWAEQGVAAGGASSGAAGAAEVAFLGLVWNWSVYPRLIVWRSEALAESPAVAGAPAAGVTPLQVAQRLSTCAVTVGHYIAARESVARDLFLARNSARMWVVASEPAHPDWPREVPLGEEVAVFDFSHPWVADLDAFAAVFVGEQPAILNFLSLLPQLRTNLTPLGAPRFLAVPD